MRIGMVVPGGVDRSGEERIIPAILSLLERLTRRHEVHVVVPGQEAEPGSWTLRGATVHNVRRRGWRFSAWRLLRRLHREAPFDLFHALWARGPGEVAWVAAASCGRPFIVHLAGGELVWMPEVPFGTRRAAARRLARFVLRCAARVTAASGPMIRLAEEAGVRAEALPLGADTAVWTPSPPRPREAGRAPRLVAVGSVTEVKGPEVLLRAFESLAAEVHGATLDVVGFDALDGGAHRLTRDLGIEEAVRFHGFLQPARAVEVVRGADALVVASHHEAGPVAMLEAAAVGVPAVGSAVGHLADWAPEAAVAVPPGDPEALAGALRTLFADDARRLAIASEAQRRSLERDADWTAAAFERIYEEVAGGR